MVGSLRHQLKNLPGTIDALEKALTYEPDNVGHLVSLGEFKRQAGAVEAAIALLEKAIAIAPDNAGAWVNLGTALQEFQRIPEAKAAYAKALEIAPEQAEVANNLGALAKQEGNWEEALRYFNEAVGIKPDFPEAHYNLGIALQSLGRLDEAAMSYRRTLEYKPNWASPYFNLHALLVNRDDMTASIKCMEKAVELDSSNPKFRFFLGMLLDYAGDLAAAAEHFDKVEKSENLYRAQLDAWRYLKSDNTMLPPITGSNIQAFKIGIDAAVTDGLVMEFGVWLGTSIRQISGLVDQVVHGFDSFEGLPEQWHHEPKGSYSAKGVLPSVPDNVTLYAGWFEDTLPEFLKNNIGNVRFMNIDCDTYGSTKTVLDLLADRIVPGTVIIFDEYIGNEHWREDEFKAFQEAVNRYNWGYEYICFSFSTKQVGIRIGIKAE